MSGCINPFIGRCRPGVVAAGVLAMIWVAAWRSSVPLQVYTPLHAAAFAGDLDEVRRLACVGRNDLDARDALGETPLHYAAQAGHADVVRWLIERGAASRRLRAAPALPLARRP